MSIFSLLFDEGEDSPKKQKKNRIPLILGHSEGCIKNEARDAFEIFLIFSLTKRGKMHII